MFEVGLGAEFGDPPTWELAKERPAKLLAVGLSGSFARQIRSFRARCVV